MRTTFLGAGLMAAIVTLGCVATAQAQVTGSQQTTTTTTTIYPSSPMAAPVVSKPMTGAVQTNSYNNRALGIKTGKGVAKTIVLQPGYGQVTLDGLRWREEVNLTLVNPSVTPLQFETTQNKGKVRSMQVPAHSQMIMTYSQPFLGKDDIKFYVMQQPQNAIASNQDYVTQQTAAVATVQNAAIHNALEQQTALLESSQQRQTAQLQNSQEQALRAEMLLNEARQRGPAQSSAVRGYW